jgi:hypothetical protein
MADFHPPSAAGRPTSLHAGHARGKIVITV